MINDGKNTCRPGWLWLSQGLFLLSVAVTLANHLLLRLSSQAWFAREALFALRIHDGGHSFISAATPTVPKAFWLPLASAPDVWRSLLLVACPLAWLVILVDLRRGRIRAGQFWWCSGFLIVAILLAVFALHSLPLARE